GDRLAAVESGHAPANAVRQRRLAGEGELPVQHDTCRTSGDAGGRGVRPDASMDVKGNPNFRSAPLEEYECCLLADAAARFVALQDDAVRTGRCRRGGRGLIRGLYQDTPPSAAEGLNLLRESAKTRPGDEDGLDFGGQPLEERGGKLSAG